MAQQHNDEMNLAWRFIESTNVSVFLTGKAGTGKTTFLHRIKELAPKRLAVVAPTGVAAINAHGSTIHSFFQLSPGVHVPGMKEAEKSGKSRFYQMSKEKKNVLRTLDLLIIDEISMVRCDLLDAIDGVLRKYKDRNLPFGGVQLLMIGDLQQLAPVAADQEWQLLAPHYDTSYFFSSKALQQIQYVTIELKRIYRQVDDLFVSMLAKVREGRIDEEVQRTLGARYLPQFHPPTDEGWIRLTTHNYMAQRYNETQLAMLPTPLFTFTAKVEGNFAESSYPAELQLALKVGAQVMFLKNDPTAEHLYYNGKIGTITALTQNSIQVRCTGEARDIHVPVATWENVRYQVDEITKEIKEEVDGIFAQFPLRLAWAITIHKSQGLTFDHAVLDINDAFAHGQVYVALSRCRTLEGLVLARPLSLASLQSDTMVEQYISTQLEAAKHAGNNLNEMRFAYFRQLIDELFNLTALSYDFNYVVRIVDEHLYHQQPDFLKLLKQQQEAMAKNVLDVTVKFRTQYHGILNQLWAQQLAYAKDETLQDRLRKAAAYFRQQLLSIFVPVLNKAKFTIGNKQVKKQFDGALETFQLNYQSKIVAMTQVEGNGFDLHHYLHARAVGQLASQKTKGQAASQKTKGQAASQTTTRQAAVQTTTRQAVAPEPGRATRNTTSDTGVDIAAHSTSSETKENNTMKNPKRHTWQSYWKK
ncbi:MAG: AAA family ATPase [Bacteroidales bacterium]|nr:AAA family ATPase [Candidatus Physcousia equi]